MSGLGLSGVKLNDFAKRVALIGGGLYVAEGEVAQEVNVPELPGDD